MPVGVKRMGREPVGLQRLRMIYQNDRIALGFEYQLFYSLRNRTKVQNDIRIRIDRMAATSIVYESVKTPLAHISRQII